MGREGIERLTARRTGAVRRHAWWWGSLAAILNCFVLWAAAAPLSAQTTPPVGPSATKIDRNFDHGSTGFPLTGAHITAACETCHAGAVFKGLPHACVDCHNGLGTNGGNASGKPADHLPSGNTCTDCHVTEGWKKVHVDHKTVTGTCVSCHNGIYAVGMHPSHVPATNGCETCHTTQNFTSVTPVTFDHSQVSATCATCHDGKRAPGKTAGHPPTSQACERCHSVVAYTSVRMDHRETPAECAVCHNGALAKGKTPTHILTSQPCGFCHKSTLSFKLAKFDHTGITTGCAACHNNVKAIGQQPAHIPTTAPCEQCHKNTTSFKISVMDHTGLTAPCATCHNGKLAKGISIAPLPHIPTSQPCDLCHAASKVTYQSWSPGKMDHTGLSSNCVSCHGGQFTNVKSKSPKHLPTSLPCENCHHSTITFLGVTAFDHTGITTGCATCHDGTAAKGMSAYPNHIPAIQPCETCHKSTVAFGPNNPMNHLGIISNCVQCHDGTHAKGTSSAPTPHIPLVLNQPCETCHAASLATFATWKPGTMNHTGITTNCVQCHGGQFAAVKTSTAYAKHIPLTSPPTPNPACELCHTSTTAFGPGTQMNHTGMTTNCATCHNNTMALGKSATHIATNQPCELCHHSTVSFLGSGFDHTGLPSTGCASCHNGTMAAGTSAYANHIATTQPCQLCHVTTAAAVMTNPANWKPGAMKHAGLPATGCAICHNGTNAQGTGSAPLPHIATSQPCELCHTKTAAAVATDPANWNPGVMNHAGITTGCANCHNGQFSNVKKQADYLTHITTTQPCETCHKSTVSFASTPMNHAGLTAAGCASCHNATNAKGTAAAPNPHIPLTLNQPCELCHVTTAAAVTTNPASWSPGVMNHTGITSGCATCHDASFAGVTTKFKTKTNVSTTHITTSLPCENCHFSTVTFLGATATFNHIDKNGNPITSGCATCHAGPTPSGKVKPAAHIPTTAPCEQCHHSTVSFLGATFDHTGLPSTGCASCHNGATAQGTSAYAPHIPLTLNQPCEKCHLTTAAAVTSNPANWKTGVMKHAGLPATGCAACHNGTLAKGTSAAPLPHITTAQPCELCHVAAAMAVATDPANWNPGVMNHAGITTGCANCHNGQFTNVKKQADYLPHITTTQPCETCHKSTASFANTAMNHAGLSATGCASCHNGTNAQGTSTYATHITTAQPCELCHATTAAAVLSNPANWKTGVMNHAGIVTNCVTCHNGKLAKGQSSAVPAHIPTLANQSCEFCHTTTNFTAWGPGTLMNHTGITTNCAQCHNGQYSNVKSTPAYTKHIPLTTPPAPTPACETCHTSTVAFGPGTAMNHTGISSGCAACHNDINALGKASYLAGHIATSLPCESCHSKTNFTAWGPGTAFNHNGVKTGCATCHNGTTAQGVSVYSKHIPITATPNCETCHTLAITLNTYTAWGPGSPMAHGSITTGCASCHNDNNALGKASYFAGHITTSQPCELCHAAAIPGFTNWKPGVMSHSGLPATGCASCHNGTLAKGTSSYTNHIPLTVITACETCHTLAVTKSFTAWGPLTPMNHTGLPATNCKSCHNGTLAKGAVGGTPYSTHIPAANMGTAACETCHTLAITKTTFTAWGPGTLMVHSAPGNIVMKAGPCNTCHNGSTAKWNGSGHHAKSPDCSTGSGCHNSFSSFSHQGSTPVPVSVPVPLAAPKPAAATLPQVKSTAPVDHSTVTGACISCHNGATATGRTPLHLATSSACDSCHLTRAWKPVRFDHSAAKGTCASCHNGFAVKGMTVTGKPRTHVATNAPCDTCHKSTNWRTAAARLDHRLVTGTCVSCHNGSTAAPKMPAKHFLTNRGCETCHATTSWDSIFRHTPARYPGNHLANLSCVSCHTSNSEIVPWRNPAFAPACAACHSVNFKPMQHIKTLAPAPLPYTVSELRDCAGACHTYTDPTQHTIKTRRTGYHRLTSPAW